MKNIIIFILILFINSAFADLCEDIFLLSKGNIRNELLINVNRAGHLRLSKLHNTQIKSKEEVEVHFERDLQAIRASKQEPVLAGRGFSPAYYRGVDQVREFNMVARYLRGIKAKPKITHIPYFAEQAEKMLDLFTKDFKEQNKENIEFLEDRWGVLKVLKKEIQERIKEQTATYDWWANFNLKLALLADESRLTKFDGTDREVGIMMDTADAALILGLDSGLVRGIQTFNEIKQQIFPEEIIFFSMDTLGIMALNRLESQSYIVGVTTKTWEADDLTMEPVRFFEHDLEHINFYRPINQYFSPTQIRLDERIKQVLNSLSNKSDQEKAEIALFIFKHESVLDKRTPLLLKTGVQVSSRDDRGVEKKLSREEKREYLMKLLEAHIFYLFNKKEFKELLPENIKTDQEIELFVEEALRIFNTHFLDIFIPKSMSVHSG